MSFLHIAKVRVPILVVNETLDHLREMGGRGMEGFALWVGTENNDVFQVTHSHIPDQQGIISDSGVLVMVGPEALHEMNVWLYTNRLKLIAQIHSHPTDAYHSGTDDDFPIATTRGGFSLVVPDFARHPFNFSQWATYRLSAKDIWEHVPASAALRAFCFE